MFLWKGIALTNFGNDLKKNITFNFVNQLFQVILQGLIFANLP